MCPNRYLVDHSTTRRDAIMIEAVKNGYAADSTRKKQMLEILEKARIAVEDEWRNRHTQGL